MAVEFPLDYPFRAPQVSFISPLVTEVKQRKHKELMRIRSNSRQRSITPISIVMEGKSESTPVPVCRSNGVQADPVVSV